MDTSQLQILELHGTARERGHQHGEALREKVREHRDRWADALFSDTGLGVEEYLDKLLAETDFLPAIERWTPELLEEVRGIAEGADVDFRYALARQLSDEEPWSRRERRLRMAGALACSSIGVDAGEGRATLVGQNMDCPDWYDGHQVLLKLSGPDMATTVYNYSVAGKINLCGANSHGLGMCCNTLSQLDYSTTGLPEDFVVRGFLAHTDLEEALVFMRAITHASGQNYTVGAPGSRALNLEASARSVVEYRPWVDADRVFHSNHPLVNPDQGMFDAVLATTDDPESLLPGYNGSSFPRFARLAELLGEGTPRPDIAAMKAAFSDHDGQLCRHPEPPASRTITLGSILMELAEAPTLHIAPGPPCSTPFTTVPLVA